LAGERWTQLRFLDVLGTPHNREVAGKVAWRVKKKPNAPGRLGRALFEAYAGKHPIR